MTGEVFAVASGKGGVGKTTTVVNLGVVLRQHDHTVALVDADLGMANLATMFGVDAETSLHDVLSGSASLDDAVVEEASGFAILPGGTTLDDFAAADPARLGAAIDTLADRYDYVLIDTGAGLSYEDVYPLALADSAILVTTPDPAAVGDATKTRELASLVDTPVRGVVITHADSSTDVDAILARLDVELLGLVPRDPAVPQSTAGGSPLPASAPDSAATEAYGRLVETLTTGEAPLRDLDALYAELPEGAVVPAEPAARESATTATEESTGGGGGITRDELMGGGDMSDELPDEQPTVAEPAATDAVLESDQARAAEDDVPVEDSDSDLDAGASVSSDDDPVTASAVPDSTTGGNDRGATDSVSADADDGLPTDDDEPGDAVEGKASPEKSGGLLSRLFGLFR